MKPTDKTSQKSPRNKALSPRDELYSFITDLEELPLKHTNLPLELLQEHKAMLQKAWQMFDKARTAVPSSNESKTS